MNKKGATMIDLVKKLMYRDALEDLIWYDGGPLISLHKDSTGRLYLESFHGGAVSIHLWISITHELAISYLKGNVDLLTCIKEAEKLLKTTVKEKPNSIVHEEVTFSELKEEDLPEKDYFLNESTANKRCNIEGLIRSIENV
jgi:hypothetical protein